MPARIWVVEDDSHYRQTLGYLIDHTSGMQCAEVFGSGESILARLGQQDPAAPPDVILMDINLPGLSGIACTSRLKARLPEVPIIMLTIRDDEETIFEAFCAGASGYLLKDAPIDKIIAAIREACSGGMLMPGPVAQKVLGFFTQENPPDYGLSDREKEVLQKMVDGYTQKEIAAQLFVSPSTINGHIQSIYQKLHVHSGTAAVAKAVRERLV